MKQQVLSPRMQNAEEANLGAKMFRIGGDFEESVGHGAEQQVVQFDFVLADEGVQVMRQSEHDMEVRGLKKFPLSGRDPTLPCLGLTLGAMPIATRNGDLSITCFMGSISLWVVSCGNLRVVDRIGVLNLH